MPTGADPTLAEAETGQPAVMGFFDHLAELRRRLLYCLGAVAVCCLLGVMFWQEIYTFLSAPMSAAFAQAGLGDKRLIFTGPLVPIKFALQVGLYAGLFLSGAYFAHRVVLPLTMTFLLDFGREMFDPLISVNEYFSLWLTMVLWMRSE